MSVILFVFVYVHITLYFSVIFVSIRHRYINVDVPNVHTHVSAVYCVSDSVSLVIVSDGFANTNVVQRGEIHVLYFSGWLLLHRFCISICI